MNPNALSLFTNRLEQFPDVPAPIVHRGWLHPSPFQSFIDVLNDYMVRLRNGSA